MLQNIYTYIWSVEMFHYSSLLVRIQSQKCPPNCRKASTQLQVLTIRTFLLENLDMAHRVGPSFLLIFLYLHSVACLKRGMGRGQAICRRSKQIITLTIHLRHLTWKLFISLTIQHCVSNETERLILQDKKKISEHVWHSEDRASLYSLIIKPTRCTNFSGLFLE